jgi:hypothetical protein
VSDAANSMPHNPYLTAVGWRARRSHVSTAGTAGSSFRVGDSFRTDVEIPIPSTSDRLDDVEVFWAENCERVRPRAGDARRYPAGADSAATTICPRVVVLSRISFTGW